MNTRKCLPAVAALLMLGSAAAWADPPHHWRHHDGGRAHFGVFIGSPFWGPRGYPPPPYYYPRYYPPTIVVEQPPVYIERAPPAVAPAPAPAPAQSYWYYCAAAKGYYPYVKECPSGWDRVPAQPGTP